MASTSNTQTATSSLSSLWKYEVFINFRGADTRNNFTDHLYHALVDKGITTFRDDDELELGKSISPELLNAIETSRVAVVVLSKTYASSTWCLVELAKIVERMKAERMRVFPIFYHVDPSDVRHQKGTFGDAFIKHEKRPEEEVQRWRDALGDVANLAGHHLKDGSEHEFICNLVGDIFQHLNNAKYKEGSAYEAGLVGIDSRFQELELCMDLASDDALFVGITGMRGIGKTTLAEVAFERIRCQFDEISFLRDAKRRTESELRDQLLGDLRLATGFSTPKWTEAQGINVMSDRLHHKKVLIVFDDVEREKFDKLALELKWFGPGSRIMLTTTDERFLLSKCRMENIYNIKKLNTEDALLLLSRKVLSKIHSQQDLVDICIHLVSYAGGNPLALQVLGSYLPTKETHLWKPMLKELREDPENSLTKTLKTSIDGLNPPQKELFLDIACFFNGFAKDFVSNILKGCHGIRADHIDDLVDKSLITIFEGKLWMHSLLQDIGQQIVKERGVTPSRIWDWEGVFEVLKDKREMDLVEGIMLFSPPHQDVQINAADFTMMTKLRLLTIDNVQLPRGLNFLSNELCVMMWDRYPLKSLPRTFGPKKLVLLRMHDSQIKELPKGLSNLDRLKILDFTDSQNLVKTPDFIGLPNLEILIFQGCTRLCVVHSSISHHKRLTLLNLEDCKCLRSLPHKINMESLETFILSGCSSLKTFPEIGLNMMRLSTLYLDGTSIEELPLSMEHLTALTLLDLQGCKSFSSFPNVIYSLTTLKSLNLSGVKVQEPRSWHFLGLPTVISSIAAIALVLCANCFFLAQHPEPQPNFVLVKSLTRLCSLEVLNLSNCSLEDGALPDDLSCLSSLTSLNLSRNRLTRLPDGISQLFNLAYLCLDGCSRLQSLTNLPLSIRLVEARECASLENYSNQFIVWTSGESGYAFIDCVGVANKEDLEVSMSSANLFYSLTSRFIEKTIDELGLFHSMIPQIEIPNWFRHQNEGSSVPVPLPPELYNDSSWRGIALCTVFVVHENFNNVSRGQASTDVQMFFCRLDMDGGVVDSPIAISIHRDKLFPCSFGLWLLISRKTFRERLNARGSISPSLSTNNPDIEIKQTGARILYKKDVLDFLQNLNQQSTHFERMNTHLQVGYCIGFERRKIDKSNGQTDSNAKLKRELKFLLSKLYQEDKGKTHWYDYIFPQTSIPRWFKDRDFLSRTEMQLPSDWQNNTRWIGVAACALYTVQKQPVDSVQCPEICLSFFSAGSEVASTRLMTFPLSRDIFAESHRLLVFYIPRILFPLDQCSKIWVSFHNNDTSLEVETCGVRLVDETDIGAFVRMLVQCMLQCPDVYHEFYRKTLLDQVAMSEGCDHGENSGYSFSTRRKSQPMPKLFPSTENVAEGCTSLGVFPDQAIRESISRDSTPTFVYSDIPFARNPSSTSFDLGIPFGHGRGHGRDTRGTSIDILESLFKTYFQDTNATSKDIIEFLFKTFFQGQKNTRAIWSHCYPQSEIPRWFCHQNDSASRTILLSPSMYDNPDWMGFAVCGLFSFHKHPTAILKNLNATASHEFSCLLALDSTRMLKVNQSITEDEVLISLCQRSFTWVLFIPRKMNSSHWGHCVSAEFSFVSDSPDVSPLKCGVTPVYQQNLKDFGDTMLQLLISYIRYSTDIRRSCKESAVYERLPILLDKNLETDNTNEELKPQGLPFDLTEPCRNDGYQILQIKCKHSEVRDFDPSFMYFSCFPLSKPTQDWFSHRSCGHSVAMDMPPNLSADNNWLGLALYACFSIDGDTMPAINRVLNGIKHFLYCHMSLWEENHGFDAGLGYSSNEGEEVTFLTNLGQCIWISYFPRWKFKDTLDKCTQLEASFVSDLPGVIVQNCALGLLYQHNQLQLEQRLKHCNSLTIQYRALALSVADRQTIKEQSLYEWIDTTTHRNLQLHIFKIPNIQTEADGTKAQLNTSDLLDLHGCSIYSLCFPPTEVLDSFSKRSNGPALTIAVPTNLCNNDWMGLLLCAHFSCNEHETAIPEKPDSAISHRLICHMECNVASVEPILYDQGINKEELTWLCTPDGIFWLLFVPRRSFPDFWSNRCSYLEASFICDRPGVVIQKCGGRFIHVLEEMELEQIIFRCITIPVVMISKLGARVQRVRESPQESHTHSTTGLGRTNDSDEDQQNEISTRSCGRDRSNGTENLYNQSNEPDFDKCPVYTSCFPPSEILDWFSRQSDEPTMVITPPPNFQSDHTWMGLALVVSFSVQEHSTNIVTNLDSQSHCLLFCHSEGIEPFHAHFLTKENLMLFRLGGFIWLSYIPRGWFSNWLNHSSSIEASIVADYPGLTMQKWGFRYLHQNEEIEWRKTKKHCEDVLHQMEETIKPIHEDKEKPSTSRSSDEDSRLERLSGSPDPKLKDKGKRVVD